MSTILIGVDASERSADAIAFGGRLAAVCDADVVVACAYPSNDRAADALHRDALVDDAERTACEMRDRLDGIRAERLRVRAAANSSPAHALHDLAESEQAEIIVVGSSHTGHLGRVLPGSTGERLLHGSPCAVAIVPHGYRTRANQPIRRIGVAYDGSAEATAAVNAAIDLSRAFAAELEIIGVVAPAAYGATGMMGGPIDLVAIAEDNERCVQESLDAVLDRLPEGVAATGVRLAGEPAEALGEHSATLDLMLAGSRGYGPLRSILVGGVSGRLTRAAQCPMIVVARGAQVPLGTLFPAAAAIAM